MAVHAGQALHEGFAGVLRAVEGAEAESAERDGRKWSSPQVHAWTIQNGKATVFWQFQGDQQTEDEFWS